MIHTQQSKLKYPYSWLSSISAIASDNRGIGYKGQLCYYIKKDLQRFKKLTEGNIVIMGSNTYRSLPKGALPNRTNIVISNSSKDNFPNCLVYSSLEGCLEELSKSENPAFIIGGEMLYKSSLPYVSKVYLTEIKGNPKADTFFPELGEDFVVVNRETFKEEETYDFIEFRRVSIL